MRCYNLMERKLIEIITSKKYKIDAYIYKLERCNIYWLTFYDLLMKEKGPKVEIINTSNKYNYRNLISDIKSTLFRETAKKFSKERLEKLKLTHEIKTSLKKAVSTEN